MAKGRKNKRRGLKGKNWLVTALILCLAGGFLIWFDSAIKPVLAQVAQVEVKEMMSIAINDAVKEKVWEEASELEFLKVEAGEDGTVSMISANTAYINRFASELTEMIHEKVESLSAQKVGIPLGSILGSELLSQTGPEIGFRIKPLGMAKVDFKTEFDSSGINQTKYKIYLEVNSKAKPLIPFLSDPIEFSSVIPIAETVVVGKVPQTYIGFSEGSKSGGSGTSSVTGISEGERSAVISGGTAAAVINGINLSQLE